MENGLHFDIKYSGLMVRCMAKQADRKKVGKAENFYATTLRWLLWHFSVGVEM